jgi:hypothetical protein
MFLIAVELIIAETKQENTIMGYSHYWRQSRPFTAQEWTSIANTTRQVIQAAEQQGIVLQYEDTVDQPPEITDAWIRFNGVGHEGYETFLLERAPANNFNFCKTAYQPYDVVVVSVLATARDVAPDAITVSSDGGDEAISMQFKF